MTIVTTSEAQAMLPRLLASVAQGEEVLITEGGLPVAQLVQPTLPRPAQPNSPANDLEEDEERPWRGVFAIESPGQPYADGMLHLPPEPLAPEQQPADILWDRMNPADE
jgi:antitoxin (DNA-binding transcriptional repressor) of toxin-antitoxin stability system